MIVWTVPASLPRPVSFARAVSIAFSRAKPFANDSPMPAAAMETAPVAADWMPEPSADPAERAALEAAETTGRNAAAAAEPSPDRPDRNAPTSCVAAGPPNAAILVNAARTCVVTGLR